MDDRYTYFIRLWNRDGDELDLEHHESEYRAWQQIDGMQSNPDSIINTDGKWTDYDIVRLDWHTHEEMVVDGGEL